MVATSNRWMAVALLSLVLAACGSTQSGSGPQEAQLRRALAVWSSFPVNASPRPLVIVGPFVNPPASGFSNGTTKLAFVQGSITYPSPVWPPAPTNTSGYSTISPSTALQALTPPPGKAAPATTPLIVTSVKFGSSIFQTDRGTRSLPAWYFWFQGVSDPAAVLAVYPSNLFLPSHLPSGRGIRVEGAVLGSDGRTLRLAFGGAPSGSGPCTADYSVTTAASTKAVAVAIDEHLHDSGMPCAIPGKLRYVTTTLSVPLGNRVLVNAPEAMAIPVTTAGPPTPLYPSVPSPPAVTSSAPLCTNSQVAVSDGGGGAGLGHENQIILFTNQSNDSCTLSGYPGIAALNSSGQEVVQAERSLSGYLGGLWNNATTPPSVTLQPGGTASAIVEGTDNPVGTETSCPYYPELLVTPPNLTTSVRITVTGLGTPPENGLPGCTSIQVHPVVTGNTGTTR